MKSNPNFWAGVCACVTGLIIALLGAGAIPAKADDFHAPHWVVTAAGAAFSFAGAAILLGASAARDQLGPWRRLGVDLCGLAILVCFAAMFTWVGFGPGERQFSGGVPFIGAKANNGLGRFLFGGFGLVAWVAALAALVSMVRGWAGAAKARQIAA